MTSPFKDSGVSEPTTSGAWPTLTCGEIAEVIEYFGPDIYAALLGKRMEREITMAVEKEITRSLRH